MTRHHRHNKVLKMVKGHMTSRGHLYRTAHQEMMRSLSYAYRDRRTRKRDMRSLWIVRINAAARQHGLPYNRFMAGLTGLGLEVDRKMLADMAVNDPLAFASLAYKVRGEAMPADVRARLIAQPPAAPTEAPAPPAEAAAAAPATTEAEAAAPEAASAAAPETTEAEDEAEAAGAPLEHAGTDDPVEEGHGDPQQGPSR